jgi:hypothetical protein
MDEEERGDAGALPSEWDEQRGGPVEQGITFA